MAGQKDLFPGMKPSKGADPAVDVQLHVHDGTTDKAWLLSRTGLDRAARFVPKSVARQDEKNPNTFTMPRSVALEKGWL